MAHTKAVWDNGGMANWKTYLGSGTIGVLVCRLALALLDHYSRLEVLVKLQHFLGPVGTDVGMLIAIATSFVLIVMDNRHELRRAIESPGIIFHPSIGNARQRFKWQRLKTALVVIVSVLVLGTGGALVWEISRPTPLPPAPSAPAVVPMITSDGIRISTPSRTQRRENSENPKVRLARQARALGVDISAFLLGRKRPAGPADPADNEPYRLRYEAFLAESVSDFGRTLGKNLYDFQQELAVNGLGDAQLNMDVKIIKNADITAEAYMADLPVRLSFIARHLSSDSEMEILRLPLKRRLTPSQEKILLAALSGCSLTIWVGFVPGENDAEMYAKDLYRVLKKAGCPMYSDRPVAYSTDPGGSTIEPKSSMGLRVLWKSPPTFKHQAFVRSLSEIDLQPTVYEVHGPMSKEIADLWLLIGRMPIMY